MKKGDFLKRLLCMMLVVAMMAAYALPGAAVGSDGKTNVSFTKVDNDRVSAGLTPNGQTAIEDEIQYADSDVVRVSIILKKASTIEAGFEVMDIASDEAAVAYRENLKKEQVDMVQQIETAIKTDLDVVWNLTLAANIISANVKYGQIEAIKNLPGVKSVVLENQYLPAATESTTVNPNMATSGAQIGTSPVWAAGYTGAGMRIAVIDTGIDTNHQSMNAIAFEYALAQLAEKAGMTYEEYITKLDLLDAEEIASVAGELNVSVDPAAAHVNSKIAFGFNYRDFDYDVTHDNDEQGDHGSHVAGIATANSWLYNPASGNFGKALDYCYMQGVAPEAQLLAMKVFGKNGSPYDSDFFAAIEDAIVLGADAINLSLGSTAPGRGHHTNKEFQAIMDGLTESGVVVAISAGNSGSWVEMAENGGYLYSDDVSMDTVGQPGAFTNSLCVASVENDGMVGMYFTVQDQMIVYIEEIFNDMKSLVTLAGEQEYVFIDGIGSEADWAALADVLPGKIAICSRGETNFTEKARLAVEAGAIAVMIYNNQGGIIYLDMTEYYHDAPVVSLTKTQGAIIRENSTPVYDADGNLRYLKGTMNISKTMGKGEFGSEYYTMSDFSSWGVPGSLEMKPEITAPGGNIFSLEGMDPSGGAYAIKSGTSMASPQVAGMAALMSQYIQENNLEEKTGVDKRHLAQSLLMSTATPILEAENTYYPILQQGAGLANINDAINANSYIMMAAGTNSGAEDGKVKVELFDDPERTGAYSATFTVYNLHNTQQTLNLNADFFMQGILSDGTFLYMDMSTVLVSMDLVWTVDGKILTSNDVAGLDFNGDNEVNAADGQILLDYATGLNVTLTNKDKADLDNDGDIDSHDAYSFLRSLNAATTILPANGSVKVTVDFTMPEDLKEEINALFPNGTYVQGYLFAETLSSDPEVAGTKHSIPVLGFYGNWSDPSMFDQGQWTTYATEEDKHIPYVGRTRGNDFKVRYANDPNYHYSFGGNPLVTDSVYMPERNAINSNDTIHGVSFIAIRHADQSRVTVVNETTGNVILDQKTGAVNMAYYYNDVVGWQNSGMILETNMSLKSAQEDDIISMEFTLVPEYYVDENGDVDWDALGKGTTISTSMVIDNTAPELKGVSIDLLNNTMTITASDNQYIAAAGIYNKTGTRCLARTGAKQDIEKGEVADYTFSLDGINGKKFLVQVHDYAMNVSTYLIEMQIGENAGIPDMMAYDVVQRHWTTFTNSYEYDYKVGTPRLAYADFDYYAATIADHYVFAATSGGDLYVMPEDDLSDTTFIVDMGVILYDMAYNKADGNIYGITENNDIVMIDKLTGELTTVARVPFLTNTLAISEEGEFYSNELGGSKVWAYTLDTINEPTLLVDNLKIEILGEPELVDLVSEGLQGMEYDPNKDIICWNSHHEYWGGAVTFAYYYEINPKTGEVTQYNDFWHEMTCLMIPDNSGRADGWASPTDEVFAVKLNKQSMNVIKGTTGELVANVQPWTATDRSVTWTSSDESVAIVDKNGVVTGIAPGTATITATSNLDPTMSATCEITVELLEVTINGTLMDENGQSMFYSWDMATAETWTPGQVLPIPMTSATYSTREDVYYIMDTTSALMMHKMDKDGNILESAENVNAIPLWDMVYSETFSTMFDWEMVTSIYYTYLLSPKDPMALDAVGFDLSSMCNYLVGISSYGTEMITDDTGIEHEAEHLVMLDNDGYVWHFWIYARANGGYDAMYAINKSNLNCAFPGDDTMEHMYTSLMVGDDGNLYLATYNGKTSELYHMSFDEADGRYNAVLLGDMGDNVWPATITSVTVNGAADATNSAKIPAPTQTMSSATISKEELLTAGVSDGDKGAKIETAEQIAMKLALMNTEETTEESAPAGEHDNTVTVDVLADVNTTNGVVTVKWDASLLKLTGIRINGQYTSKLEGEGNITFGYVALGGIAAGKTVATLVFEPIATTNTTVSVTHKQINNTVGRTLNVEVNYEHPNTEIRGFVAATCTTDGYSGDVYCTDCGALVAKGEVIKATGHEYVDGFCKHCGVEGEDINPPTGDSSAVLVLTLMSFSVMSLAVVVFGRKKLMA